LTAASAADQRGFEAPSGSGRPDGGGGGGNGGGNENTGDDKKGDDKGPGKKRSGRPDDGGGGGGPGGGGDSSDFESAGSNVSARSSALIRHLRKKKFKEADEIKVQALPGAAGFRAWKNLTYAELNKASGRPDDKVLAWPREVEDELLELEHLCAKAIRHIES
jgi:hypothetical protein